MITTISVGVPGHSKDKIFEYLSNNKKVLDNIKTIIDVGGAAAEWSREISTHFVDIRPIDVGNKKLFQFDLCDPAGWKQVEDYVAKNGKFDFCICTHTLEDLINPKYVCEKISEIAKSGVISFPSKYKELHRHEHALSPDYDGNRFGSEYDEKNLRTHRGKFYRGYGHHFWYMSIDKDGAFFALPKCGMIEVDPFYDAMGNNNPNFAEVCFFWQGEVSCYTINGAVLFDNVQKQIAAYRHCIVNDAIDVLCGFKWTVLTFSASRPEVIQGLIEPFEYYGDYYLVQDDDEEIRKSLIDRGEFPREIKPSSS